MKALSFWRATPTVSTAPGIAIDPSNNIHIIWRDGTYWDNDWNHHGTPKIFYRKKDFVTGEWSQSEQLVDSFHSPEIAADSSGGLHVIALANTEVFDIYYFNWDGIEWSTPIKAVYPNYSGYYSFDGLEITTDSSDYPHIAWRGYFQDEDEIYWNQILYSSFNGSTWSEIEEVSDRILGYQYRHPSIVTDSTNRPHIIWFTEETGGGSFSAIEYKNRSSLGWSISMYIIPDSHRPQGSTEPCSLTISNDDQLHVAWVAGYSGNSEIFYNNADVSQDVWPPSVQLLTPTTGQTISIGESFDITWTCVDDVEVASISLDYTTDGGENYTNIASGLSNDEIYPWTPDILSNTVQIRITAYDGQDNEGSDISGVFTISDFALPTVTLISPNGGEVWDASSQQSIIWDASDNVGISSTDLFYSSDNGTIWTPIETGLQTGSPYLWTVHDTVASTYKIKIKVFDEEGNFAEDVSDGTFNVVIDNNIPPNDPSNPSPGDGESDVSTNTILSWTGGDPDQGDTVTYDVYFGTSTNPPLVSDDQPGVTYDPGNLSYYDFYNWKVVATDNHGASSSGPIWSFMTKIESVPESPSDLSVIVISSTQIELNWQDNSVNELGFKVERKIGEGAWSQIDVVGAETVSYIDTELSENVYYYRLRAYNASGNSNYSNEASASAGDGDGIPYYQDNCLEDYNPGQEDFDEDEVGDVCDNCLEYYNPDQLNSDDQDGGDICDICPADSTDSCDPFGSGADTVDEIGGTITVFDTSCTIVIPPDAVDADTTFSITDTEGDYELETNLGDARSVLGVQLESGEIFFTAPITVVLGWNDEDNDGLVEIDGVEYPRINETNLFITKDSEVITTTCDNNTCFCAGHCSVCGCDLDENYFEIDVTNFSEFTLSIPADSDADDVIDDFIWFEDNCPDIPNGPGGGTCTAGDNIGDNCTDNATCGAGGYCSKNQEDGDDDDTGDVCDNCPDDVNPAQEDFEQDGLGDICDPDDDNDGITDGEDECPYDPENDIDNDNFCGDDDNCPNTPNGPDNGTCVRGVGNIVMAVRVDKHTVRCTDNSTCEIIDGESYCQKVQGDINGNGAGDACECYADFNDNARIDGGDMFIIVSEANASMRNCEPTGSSSPPCCYADANGNGKIDGSDMFLTVSEANASRRNCPVIPHCPNVP